MCCYSNGGISDEWGKLFLPLSRLQKETKTPFTSANNALMWAPVPRSPHKPGSVQAANRHTGLWGHSQWHPLSVGDPCWLPRQARERRDSPPSLRPRARHAAAQPSRPSAGCLLWAEVWLLEAMPPSFVSCHSSSQAGEKGGARQGRAGGINNSHTKEKGEGSVECGARSPTLGWGGVDTRQRLDVSRTSLSSSLSHPGFALQSGAPILF